MTLFSGLIYSCIACLSFWYCFYCSIGCAKFLSGHDIPRIHRIAADDEPREFVIRWFTDGLLLLLFMLQHSCMASSLWKYFLDYVGLGVVKRSIYILSTSLALEYLMMNWQSLPATPLWLMDTHDGPVSWTFFSVVHIIMWIIILGGALTMDFWELVGIKQVYYYVCGWNDPMEYKSHEQKVLYSHMRHPGILCFLVILWIHPVMTLERFLLALNWTLYLLFGHSVTEVEYVYMEEQIVRKSVRREVHEHAE